MKLLTLLAVTGLAVVAGATPTRVAVPLPFPQVRRVQPRQDNSTAPCAKVSDAIYSVAQRPTATYIPAKLAYDCLNSIPLNASSASRLVEQLPAYIKWQSTIEVLKNPPAEYVSKVQPATDILGGLDEIASSIDAGAFKSEYDFGWALYTLILTAHDGHFTYVLDSVANIFQWGRPVPLVSVSEDGKKLPAVFAYADVLGMQFKNISYTPSPVVAINGESTRVFLEDLSQYGSLQDRDALYNNLFYELAQVSLGSAGSATGTFSGGGRGRYVYPGPTTTLKFANGTEYTMENYARVLTTFRGIQTGEDLAQSVFNYGVATAGTSVPEENPISGDVAPGPASAALGYPAPVVSGPPNQINGYYLDGAGYEDVAVLSVPSFVSDQYYELPFQQTSQQFLAKALADGKTKLVIDLQANGGGTILQGYDLFKQLFPSEDPYGANRFRYTDAADLVGQSFSAFASQFPRGVSNYTIESYQGTWFDYHQDMTVKGKPFGSWKEKIGPETINGDQYSTASRWNLSDVLIAYSSGGINITGYGPLANTTGGPRFKAENIVLLTDGYCASTCTIFSELMTAQGGVKTIAMGGRSNTSPIQAVGGVKGVNNFAFSYISSLAKEAIAVAPANRTEEYANSVLSTDYNSYLPFSRSASSGLNVRDGLKYKDTSGVALQFIYEPANCRLFYTPEMTVNAAAVWKAAADAQWKDSSKCVGRSGTYGDAEKRASSAMTSSLGSGRVRTASASSRHRFEDYEDSFALETEHQAHRDGFMQP